MPFIEKHTLKLVQYFYKYYIFILWLIFRFDWWHVKSPIFVRPYRIDVSNMVNSLKPKCVVEVGCGLGLILNLCSAKIRHGYDLDVGVIRAARFLVDRDINFTKGGLTDVIETDIDVLILVNWIHEYSPEQLASWLMPLLKRTKHILLDSINLSNANGDYKFKHDFKFLSEFSELILEVQPCGEDRSFKLYKLNNMNFKKH